jgi:cytidylate kinase
MKPFILAITGPAGSGKSTTASILAKEIGRCVNIDADLVKHMIVNGFVYAEEPEGLVQWQLMGTNIGMLAKNFQDAGYNVIINGYINEPGWKTLQDIVTIDHKVLLMPHIEAAIERDAGRQEDYRMGVETIERHRDHFSTSRVYDDFVKIDSTGHSIDETIAAVKDTLSYKS